MNLDIGNRKDNLHINSPYLNFDPSILRQVHFYFSLCLILEQ